MRPQTVGAASSDRGLRRPTNEDTFEYVPEIALFLVADGVGGHAAGEVASRIAAKTIVQRMHQLILDDDLTPVSDPRGYPGVPARRLLIAIECANDEVLRAAGSDGRLRGMATTVAAVHLTEGFASVCHVGDSRVYRIRDGIIARVTDDHATIANVLSRAVGAAPTVDATWWIDRSMNGDIFVVCSDGIHGVLTDEDIRKCVNDAGKNYEDGCATLIAMANDRGGPDNSTVIIVEIV